MGKVGQTIVSLGNGNHEMFGEAQLPQANAAPKQEGPLGSTGDVVAPYDSTKSPEAGLYLCQKPLDALVDSGGGMRPEQRKSFEGDPRFDKWPLNALREKLFHEYICLSDGHNEPLCYGQSAEGHPLGTGHPSEDKFSDSRCDKVATPDECMDPCLIAKGESKDRPFYGLAGPGTNCQEWVDDALNECQEQCEPIQLR